MLRVYNTLTRTLERFEPLHPGEVRLYTCGPTVYNYATIGNFRSFLFEDVLRRYLEYRGYRVMHVMNITDVGHLLDDADTGEDKLEVAARREKKDPWQIAAFYEEAFRQDARTLRLAPAHHYPRATEHIGEMIELVAALIAKGHAYEVNGSVYYDVTTFPAYGRLSGNTLTELSAGHRVEVHPDKRHPFDFALWIHDPRHLMQWDSPWGRGYPGWHIECSAMAMKYLGPTLDIHCGGEDNIFPHHECEIAQSEGATGAPFSRYWMHARFLLVDGRKMSKSLGNFYTLRDLLERGCDPAAIRYHLLTTHYRQPLNFTLDGVSAAREAVERLRDCARRLETLSAEPDQGGEGLEGVLSRAQADFEAAMDDDLNTSAAAAALFNLVRDLNRAAIGGAPARRALALLRRFDGVFDVLADGGEPEADEEIERLIAERTAAREAGDYARADAIRDRLAERGILLRDTPGGTTWRRR